METSYPIPYEIRVLSAYENTLGIRRGNAAEHELAMVAKYGSRLSDSETDDYHNWQEQIVRVNGEGQTIRYTHRDYPLPYTHDRYFRRFVELFLSRDSEDGLQNKLGQQFIGDEVDADYIKTLFIKAVEAGLFTDDAALVFQDDFHYSCYSTPIPGEYLPLSGIPSCNIFFGSRANELRREAIKKWLDRRAVEINHQLTVHDVLITESINKTLSPNEEQVRSFLIGDKSIIRCDSAARKIGLVLGGPLTDKADARSRIHALARGLFDAHKADGDGDAFRLALAERYSVDYSKGYDAQHYPGRDKPNRKWAGMVTSVMKACQ